MMGMGRETCDHCPLAGAGATCPRWPSNHIRYCEWVDPASPGYRPNGAEALVAMASGASPRAFPPPLERARNLAGAVVRAVASGGKRVDPEERARRLETCHACEHFDGGRCRLCGCVARWKARLASEHCPDDPPRW